MTDERIRVVFDCQVFLQAALSDRGPAARCLQAVEDGRVLLCLSSAVLDEVGEVLMRPELQARFSRLSPSLVAELVDRLRALAEYQPDVPHVFDYHRDPDDEPYLDLAIAAGAEYLVSRDNDLLDLAVAVNPDGQRLRKLAPSLAILDPVQFLAAIA